MNATKNDNCYLRNTLGTRKSRQTTQQLLYLVYAICTLLLVVGISQAAAVYSKVKIISNPNFEPLCSAKQEIFIESEGIESSIWLEFNAQSFTNANIDSCTRILSAPSHFGFIVRLILPKFRNGHQQTAKNVPATPTVGKQPLVTTGSALNEMSLLIEKINSTTTKTPFQRSCPLSIFSSYDPHTPHWRVDPCHLEDTAPEMEDPVRLFHGRVRIVWEHGHNSLHSKLMVTVLGKGNQCLKENKHQCLKIGNEPILCISKDLICDGIRHCPYSNEYDSDEDYNMCWKRRRFGEPIPPAMESDIFEHFAMEVFRNLFAFDTPLPSESNKSANTAIMTSRSKTFRKVQIKNSLSDDTSTNKTDDRASKIDLKAGGAGHHHRNSTRSGLSSDLSKYGPWGYLMLGMLLCGGALLICGLWASASQHAANNERESALQNAAANGSSLDPQPGAVHGPPNYEDLDSPPAYSVLFPNQKADSSTTLNSISISPNTLPLSPIVAVAPTSSVTRVLTQNQLELAITSSSNSEIAQDRAS